MHSIRHHNFPLLLMLLLSFTVAAAANTFVPRRQRRSYLTESLSRLLFIDLNQSKQRSGAILPFGLQIRGGDVENDVETSEVDNSEEIMEEAADSDETVKKVWEKEIKRTQSFYQEQSVTNDSSEAIDEGSNNVEDVRGYGNSETSAAQSNVVDVMEEGDDNEPDAEQADEDNVDIVEVKAESEDNSEQVEEVNEEECVTENETRDKVLKEEEETAEEEALQVEVNAEELSNDSGEIEHVDAKEIVDSEEDGDNDAVDASDEYTKEEIAESEEVVSEDIAEEAIEEVSEGDVFEEQQSAADEESVSSDEVIDISDTSSDHADSLVTEEDADAAANDESSESTPEQVNASSVAVTDEPTSLVTKVSALLQVMLLRGRIAVSKNKPKMKVIALAALGGLSLFVGGHFFLAVQEETTETLELPNDEWIEEESYVEEEADENDNDY